VDAKRRPAAPKGLGSAGRSLWRAVLSVYLLNPAELVLLGRACRVADTLDRLDEALKAAEVVTEGSQGQVRAHPLLSASAEQAKILDMLLRSLALPLDGETAGKIRSPQQAQAARTRWRKAAFGG
jgi:hypothetical protein